MPKLEDPKVQLLIDAAAEIRAVRRWRDHQRDRCVPKRDVDHLLLATWNIANLGDPAQKRTPEDLAILAELVSWFDIAAIQEVKRDFADLRTTPTSKVPASTACSIFASMRSSSAAKSWFCSAMGSASSRFRNRDIGGSSSFSVSCGAASGTSASPVRRLTRICASQARTGRRRLR